MNPNEKTLFYVNFEEKKNTCSTQWLAIFFSNTHSALSLFFNGKIVFGSSMKYHNVKQITSVLYNSCFVNCCKLASWNRSSPPYTLYKVCLHKRFNFDSWASFGNSLGVLSNKVSFHFLKPISTQRAVVMKPVQNWFFFPRHYSERTMWELM